MRAGERVYRLLLYAYPKAFRAAYEREMLLVFRDQRRERGARAARFWTETIWDVVRSAPTLQLEQLRSEWKGDAQPTGGTMKTMAILAVLTGALESVNAIVEGWGGRSSDGGGYWLAGVLLAALAGALLGAAGIALLRAGRRATAGAEVAALTCLTVVVLVRLVQPWMSTFSVVLGIAFPAALLLYLRLTRGEDRTPRSTA